MNKKYIIGMVVIVLAVWIGYAWGKGSTVAPVSEEGVKVASEAPEEAGVPVVAPTPVVQAPAPRVAAPAKAPAMMTKDGSYIVYYTDKGFRPSTIEIKAGKSVHFVNSSNKAMSIVTTDPNNQVYGELSQGTSVGKNSFYDFTFLKAGSWYYMNRNNQADRGLVVVK